MTTILVVSIIAIIIFYSIVKIGKLLKKTIEFLIKIMQP